MSQWLQTTCHQYRCLYRRLAALRAFTLSRQDWPTWRGQDATGMYAGNNFSDTWGDEDIAWWVKLAAGTNSSTIIIDQKVFIASAENREL